MYNFALRLSLYFLACDSMKEIVYSKQRCDQFEGELLVRIRREKARIWQKTVEINYKSLYKMLLDRSNQEGRYSLS